MDKTKTLKNMDVDAVNEHFIRSEYDSLMQTRRRIVDSGKMPGAWWTITKVKDSQILTVKRTS